VGVGLHASGIVEGDALVVAEGRTAGAFVGVFGDAVGPDAGEVYLSVERQNAGEKDCKKYGGEVSLDKDHDSDMPRGN
jgi:hypothetical protein